MCLIVAIKIKKSASVAGFSGPKLCGRERQFNAPASESRFQNSRLNVAESVVFVCLTGAHCARTFPWKARAVACIASDKDGKVWARIKYRLDIVRETALRSRAHPFVWLANISSLVGCSSAPLLLSKTLLIPHLQARQLISYASNCI